MCLVYVYVSLCVFVCEWCGGGCVHMYGMCVWYMGMGDVCVGCMCICICGGVHVYAGTQACVYKT